MPLPGSPTSALMISSKETDRKWQVPGFIANDLFMLYFEYRFRCAHPSVRSRVTRRLGDKSMFQNEFEALSSIVFKNFVYNQALSSIFSSHFVTSTFQHQLSISCLQVYVLNLCFWILS